MDPLVIAVAMKWVPLRVEVDPLSGAVEHDDRFAGCSAADQAALEWALRIAEANGAEVRVVTAGPAGADAVLRDALAAGASTAARVEVPKDLPSDQVARALRPLLDGADLVCCGDHSTDRGSGSVPAFLAATLRAAQALGLVRVEPAVADGSLDATRRLDYGRREILSVSMPAVLSFEGGTAELRRAPLAGVLAAKQAPIEESAWTGVIDDRVTIVRHAPYRPRPRVLPPPAPGAPPRDRILALTGGAGGGDARSREVIEADAETAADVILEHLRSWGYLD